MKKLHLSQFFKRLPLISQFVKSRPKAESAGRLLAGLEASAADGGGGVDSAHFAPLFEVMREYNIDGRKVDMDWWLLLGRTWMDYDNTARNLEELTQRTRDLDSGLLTAYEWLHLYALSLRMSLFVVAWLIREKAMEQALRNFDPKRSSRYDYERYLGACLERGDIELVRRNMDGYERRFGWWSRPRQVARTFRMFTQVWDGEFDAAEYYSDRTADLAYYEYVKGKKVAIVGPAKLELGNAEEIDSFDRVLRFNYRKKGIGCDALHNGLKTHITHFNNEQSNYLVKEKKDLNLDLDWILIKTQKAYREFSEKLHLNGLKARFLDYHDDILFNGFFNAIPVCVIDLLKFEPSVIKVFNADLMLTEKRFSNYNADPLVQQEGGDIPDYFSRDSATHDPVAQYNLLKLLWNQGIIQGDVQFSKVMEMGLEAYMMQIQDNFGILNFRSESIESSL